MTLRITVARVSLHQLDDYGPWTVTLEPCRETVLRTLQSRLVVAVAQHLGGAKTTFSRPVRQRARHDDDVDGDALAGQQETTDDQSPVAVRVSTAVGRRPAEALADASDGLRWGENTQDGDRRRQLRGSASGPVEGDGSLWANGRTRGSAKSSGGDRTAGAGVGKPNLVILHELDQVVLHQFGRDVGVDASGYLSVGRLDKTVFRLFGEFVEVTDLHLIGGRLDAGYSDSTRHGN